MTERAPIAGDFLSLLARHHAAPLGTVVAPDAPVQTQGTTVFAFHFADGILMGGDRRATAGNIIVTDRIDKVLELDATSLLAIAGVPATAFEMARVLQTSFEYYRRSQLQALSLPARVRALARLLRENIPMTMQGIGVVMPLFAGIDQSLSQAVQFALRLLMTASEFDSATGGVNPEAHTFATIKVLRGSGVETITAGR